MNTNHSRIALTALSTSVELVDVLLESLDRIRRRWCRACDWKVHTESARLGGLGFLSKTRLTSTTSRRRAERDATVDTWGEGGEGNICFAWELTEDILRLGTGVGKWGKRREDRRIEPSTRHDLDIVL